MCFLFVNKGGIPWSCHHEKHQWRGFPQFFISFSSSKYSQCHAKRQVWTQCICSHRIKSCKWYLARVRSISVCRCPKSVPAQIVSPTVFYSVNATSFKDYLWRDEWYELVTSLSDVTMELSPDVTTSQWNSVLMWHHLSLLWNDNVICSKHFITEAHMILQIWNI